MIQLADGFVGMTALRGIITGKIGNLGNDNWTRLYVNGKAYPGTRIAVSTMIPDVVRLSTFLTGKLGIEVRPMVDAETAAHFWISFDRELRRRNPEALAKAVIFTYGWINNAVQRQANQPVRR
jgi:hypothetical protein